MVAGMVMIIHCMHNDMFYTLWSIVINCRIRSYVKLLKEVILLVSSLHCLKELM
uniref:Uncharacterized protein n=1 Tax=Amphimedon queenslandica TaxID=400682 RepID=A0A1X7TC02_AMPQE